MRSVRRLLPVLLVALVILGVPGDAWAKKKKKKGGNKQQTVQMTGYASFDDVFRKVRRMDNRLTSAEQLLQSSRRDLNTALGIKRNAPLATGLADLKQKGGSNLQVVMNGAVPQLKAADAVPRNIKDAADAVNRLTNGIVGSIEDISAIPGEARALAQESRAFPNRFKQEAQHDLLGMIFKAPKTVKKLKHNTKVAAALPDRSVKVANRMNNIVSTVRGEFPGDSGGRGGARNDSGPATRGGPARGAPSRGGPTRGGTTPSGRDSGRKPIQRR